MLTHVNDDVDFWFDDSALLKSICNDYAHLESQQPKIPDHGEYLDMFL